MILGFRHAVQLSVFFKAIGAGYLLGFLFSFVMFFNVFSGKSHFSVFIRDILFFVSGALFSFLFVLKYNAGIVRFYIFAGELIGFCLFYILPGKSMTALWKKVYLRYRKLYSVLAGRIKLKNSKKRSRESASRKSVTEQTAKKTSEVRKYKSGKKTLSRILKIFIKINKKY